MPMRDFLAALAVEQSRERVADAYLLLGPSRARLRELAARAAAQMLGSRGDPSEHPDCVVLDPDALGVRGLKVEHVAARKEGVDNLEEALRYRPVKGGWRPVLLFDTDRMGPDAQAALLKTAEEPPPGTVLLLTAAEPTPLLPALRSRCRTWRVAPPPQDELARRAEAAGIAVEDWEILRHAASSAEEVLDLPSGEREELLQAHATFAAWLAGDGDVGWLGPPEGGNLAEQRAAGARRLAACLGWLAARYASQDDSGAAFLDRVAIEIHLGLADLGAQVSPAVVFEDLGRKLLPGRKTAPSLS